MRCKTQNLTDRNNCLNILKCIACIGVVFIHVPFPGILGTIVKYISTFAVPLFFMIAGYYSYGCTVDKIRKRFIKIVKILFFAIFWWFAYSIVANAYAHTLTEWLSNNFTWKTPIKFFAFCKIDWAVPLWYLIAMAETYFVWIYIVKYKMEEKATKFTWLFFVFGAVLTVLAESLGLSWSLRINFICRAMPWFMFGYLVNEKYRFKLNNIKNITLFITACLGWAVTLSAVLLNTVVNYNYVGVLLTAPALFLIGVKNPTVKISKYVEFIAEKLSLFIYIFHSLVSSVVHIAFKHVVGINQDGIYAYFHPVFSLIASIIVAMVFAWIFKNKRLRKLIY